MWRWSYNNGHIITKVIWKLSSGEHHCHCQISMQSGYLVRSYTGPAFWAEQPIDCLTEPTAASLVGQIVLFHTPSFVQRSVHLCVWISCGWAFLSLSYTCTALVRVLMGGWSPHVSVCECMRVWFTVWLWGSVLNVQLDYVGVRMSEWGVDLLMCMWEM